MSGRRALAALALGGAAVVFVAPAASAHPTDELLQQVYVTPTAGGVDVDLELTPGVLIGPAFASLIDTDGDGAVSGAEAAAHAGLLREALRVEVDGVPVPVRVVRSTYPDRGLIVAGGGAVGLEVAVDLPPATARVVAVTDSYAPAPASTGPLRSTVQASVTLTADHPVTMGPIERRDDGRTMTARYDEGVGPAATAARKPAAKTGSAPYLLAALRRPLDSPWAFGTLLGASALLGALHALTPGHGKTLLAAYLVGERGTPGQAVALGSVVTFTHTASVIAIGVAVLVAGRYVVPGVLVPALEVGAGLVVALLGIRLLVRRWGERRDHDHDHSHDHGPGPGASLLTMGVSGGIAPCPEALGVLLLAVGVHRTALGLAMILAFSAGLAAVLVGLGLILVTAGLGRRLRGATDRGSRLARLVPLGSAAVVGALGLAMAVRGVSSLAAR